MSEKHELEEMIEHMETRDANGVDDCNCSGARIEDRVELANGRGVDALLFVKQLAQYIVDKEREGGGNE